jgi:ESS family glutamate:Na+ symporter
MSTVLQLSGIETVTLGLLVFLVGVRLNRRVPVLNRLNIPEPVTGGLVASLIVLGLNQWGGIGFDFDLAPRDFLLVVFFAGIGLNARLADLIAGGKPLLVLLALTLGFIVIQNLVGVTGAVLFGFPAKAGVLFGSAALIGGHGTAIAWSPDIAGRTGLDGAAELGVAVATLGLVSAALVGGPIAGFLVDRHRLTPDREDAGPTIGVPHPPDQPSAKVETEAVMRAMMYLNLAIILGYLLADVAAVVGLMLPAFVPCLIMGIVVANLRSWLFPLAAPVSKTPALALISELALGAFLAMSLMSLQLWTIAEMGPSIIVILGAQTLIAIAYVVLVVFPLMGGRYRAAVLGAGFAGFALGATPTAIANMTAVTKHYGPSPIAFIVLPLVSAFFVDIANAIVIQAIVNF